jgi:hypothetical protein
LWAVINGAGSTVRSSGVSSSTRTDQGVFSVVFNTDVTNCSYLSQQGFATAEIVFATGFVTAQPKVGNPNALTVLTTNASGSPADRPFDVAVFC